MAARIYHTHHNYNITKKSVPAHTQSPRPGNRDRSLKTYEKSTRFGVILIYSGRMFPKVDTTAEKALPTGIH